ncbi:MAG: SCO family protein [Salibacteraceae bacterium]
MLNWKLVIWVWIVGTIGLIGCQTEPKELPYLDIKTESRSEGGKTVYDTLVREMPIFALHNQEGELVDETIVEGKVHVVDMFFINCPTICPIMKANMLNVYAKYKDNPNVLILSHSIDPERDTIAALKDYADRLGISSERWQLLTGPMKDIFKIAEAYMVPAEQDSRAPGGFLHSGAFLLLDQNRRIRGIYDGTEEGEVEKMMRDMELLLNAA